MKKIDLQNEDTEIDQDGHKVYYGGLSKIKELLDRIGNPQDRLKIIHIVGTAGKGTTANAIARILKEHGFRVGLFVSPHLLTPVERISINSELISEKEFVDMLNFFQPHIKHLRKHVKNGLISPFELATAMAFKYFFDNKVDYVVMEAGCGGKYDSTNVISKSEISVLTSVGLDHEEILGDIHMIAKDKASVCEKSGYLITAVTDESALTDVRETTDFYNSKLVMLDKNIFEKVKMNYGDKYPKPILNNLTLAFQVVKKLTGVDEIMELDFGLPARFEKILKNTDVILDGAHNISKIETLIEYLNLNNLGKCIFIFSAYEDKDFEGMIKIISDRVKKIFFTSMEFRGRKSLSLEKMKQKALTYLSANKIEVEENAIRAFAIAKKEANQDDTIIVAGSFHLAGEIRAIYWTKEKILYTRKVI